MEQSEMNEHASPENIRDAKEGENSVPLETILVADVPVVVFEDNAEQMATEVIDIVEAKRALEAALLAASEPMGLNELKRLFDGQLNPDIIRNLLDELKEEWQGRTVELAIVASGYRFRIRPEYQKYLEKLGNDKPLKYSRAVLETLAIIAYRQPCTRGDIEDIRGVAVSPHILKTLEDRGWIDEIGHRETVGRPVLFATTKHFLDDLNLRSLDELPPLHELQATLDMTQFGALLNASEQTGTLPLSLGDAAASLDATTALDSLQIDAGVEAAMEEVASITSANVDSVAGNEPLQTLDQSEEVTMPAKGQEL